MKFLLQIDEKKLYHKGTKAQRSWRQAFVLLRVFVVGTFTPTGMTASLKKRFRADISTNPATAQKCAAFWARQEVAGNWTSELWTSE